MHGSRAEEVDAGSRRGTSEGHAARGRDGVAGERAASSKRRQKPEKIRLGKSHMFKSR